MSKRDAMATNMVCLPDDEDQVCVLRNGDEQYRHDVRVHKLYLSLEKEDVLVVRARAGDRDARHAISLGLLGYCSFVAGRYARAYDWAHPSIEYQDLAQMGNETVLRLMDRALEMEKPIAYLAACIRHAIHKYCQRHCNAITTPQSEPSRGIEYPLIPVRSLDKPIRKQDREKLTLADVLEDGTQTRVREYPHLYQAISTLTHKQRETILRYYGLGNHAPEKQEDIAQSEAVCCKAISNRHVAALSNLRCCLEGVSVYG